MPVPIIECESLNKIFHGSASRVIRFLTGKPKTNVQAVRDVSFSIGQEEILGILGPNGAGKTTLVKMLCTLLIPTSGQARVCGADIVSQTADVKKNISFVASDERSFYWRLTGRQNLAFFGGVSGLSGSILNERIQNLANEMDATDLLDKRFDRLSTGNRQKLSIIRGLLSQSQALFFDEPTRSLDPASSQIFLKTLRYDIANKQRRTIILVTHRLDEALQICDRILIMSRGKMVFLGKPNELQKAIDHFAWRVFLMRPTLHLPEDLPPCVTATETDGKYTQLVISAQDKEAGILSLNLTLKTLLNSGIMVENIESSEPTPTEVFSALVEQTIQEETSQ